MTTNQLYVVIDKVAPTNFVSETVFNDIETADLLVNINPDKLHVVTLKEGLERIKEQVRYRHW